MKKIEIWGSLVLSAMWATQGTLFGSGLSIFWALYAIAFMYIESREKAEFEKMKSRLYKELFSNDDENKI